MIKLLFAATLFCAAPAAALDAKVGKRAPEFTLSDADGKDVSLSDYKGSVVTLEWTNRQCPFVNKHYGAGNMQRLQKDYTKKGVVWLSINSSAPGKAIDSIPSADPEDIKKAKNYAAAALDAVLAGKEPAETTTRPYGCGVKYK